MCSREQVFCRTLPVVEGGLRIAIFINEINGLKIEPAGRSLRLRGSRVERTLNVRCSNGEVTLQRALHGVAGSCSLCQALVADGVGAGQVLVDGALGLA